MFVLRPVAARLCPAALCRIGAALALSVAGGCQPAATPPAAQGTPAAEAAAAADKASAVPVMGGLQPATTGELGAASEAYVVQPTFVRRLPSDVKEVHLPGSKKRVGNWLATLQRGEHVRVVEAREGWLRVQSSDEASGWIKQDGVLVGPQIAQATNLGMLRRFTRPDLLALVADRPIDAGSLLFVLRQKDAFSEVNYGGTATSWVLTDALERGADEVEAAKLLHRARGLAERHDAAAAALVQLARSRFGHTRVVGVFFPPPLPTPVPVGAAVAPQASPEAEAEAEVPAEGGPEGGAGAAPAPAGGAAPTGSALQAAPPPPRPTPY